VNKKLGEFNLDPCFYVEGKGIQITHKDNMPKINEDKQQKKNKGRGM